MEDIFLEDALARLLAVVGDEPNCGAYGPGSQEERGESGQDYVSGVFLTAHVSSCRHGTALVICTIGLC